MSFQDNDSGPGFGVEGTSNTKIGVIGRSHSGPGVLGETQIKVEGNTTISSLPVGVMGFAQAGVGVEGVTQNGSGVAGASVKGTGVYGSSVEAVGVRGTSGQSDGVQGAAVEGTASGIRGTHQTDGNGVSGLSQGGNGVYGQSDAQTQKFRESAGSGVFGHANPGGYGVYGYSPSGPAGTVGYSDDGMGVFGQSTRSNGVVGHGTIGVVGSGGTGVEGNGTGVGVNGSGSTGVAGTGTTTGVSGTGFTGVDGNGQSVGVNGEGPLYGVMGTGAVAGVCGKPQSSSAGAFPAGVMGIGSSDQTGVNGTSSDGRGVWGLSTNGSGVEGYSTTGHAGWFSGDVNINGHLTKSSGKFVIDHPLAPETMYLNHSLVESPEMKNIYDGVVVLDSKGEATIKLPRWFEALNGDLRYQLTAIGHAAPNLHIASEVNGGRFRIGGGAPKVKVCWQVTGVRQDAWAKHHPMKVEERKTGRERGKYRHPEVFGKPEEMSIYWNRDPRLLKTLLKQRKRGATLAETYLDLVREQSESKKDKKQSASHPMERKTKGFTPQIHPPKSFRRPLKVDKPIRKALEEQITETALGVEN